MTSFLTTIKIVWKHFVDGFVWYSERLALKRDSNKFSKDDQINANDHHQLLPLQPIKGLFELHQFIYKD